MRIDDAREAIIPIFESTGQAVHVAFTILAEPAQQDSMLRKALLRIMGSIHLSPAQLVWMERLRGTPSETVHFEGLDASDVRAQCSLVMSAVRSKLPDPERWAIFAKYAKTDFEDLDGRRRYAFSAEKVEAIRNLSQWLFDSFRARGPSPVPLLALDCMVAKIYAHHKNTEISFRELAKAFGGNHMVYARPLPRIRKRLLPLELQAMDRLRPYFEENGIVPKQTDA